MNWVREAGVSQRFPSGGSEAVGSMDLNQDHKRDIFLLFKNHLENISVALSLTKPKEKQQQ